MTPAAQHKAALALVTLPHCSARVAFLQIFTAALLGSLIVPSGTIRGSEGARNGCGNSKQQEMDVWGFVKAVART